MTCSQCTFNIRCPLLNSSFIVNCDHPKMNNNPKNNKDNVIHREKLWHGPPVLPTQRLDNRQSLGHAMISSMKRDLTRVAQICHDEDNSSLTNEKMLQMTIRCALHLLDLGLKEGDVLGVATKNETVLAPIMVAAFTISLPINAVNYGYKKSDILYMFGITEPRVVICCPENYEDIKSVVQEIGSNAHVYVIEDVVEGGDGRNSAWDLFEPHSGEHHFV